MVFAFGLRIRPFRLDDLEQLTEFWKEATSNLIVAGDFYLPTAEIFARWRRFVMKAHEEDKNQVLVADMDGKIVGYVFFLNREDFPLETTYTWASINDLHVHLAYRRRGIATKLMKQAFNYLKSVCVSLRDSTSLQRLMLQPIYIVNSALKTTH